MTEDWAQAFKRYAADRFGDRYKYGELDPDWLARVKAGFRAGFRAGIKAVGKPRACVECHEVITPRGARYCRMCQ